MATRIWIGAAEAVKQVDTVQITAVSGTPSDTTYTITINGDVVSVVGDTDVNTTATALQVALAASLNPYFKSIVWTVATDTVTGTALTAGDPNVFAESVTGGTGTIGAVTSVTASDSPNKWDSARNWDGGVVPITADDVILEDSAISITDGLAQTAVTLASLTIRSSYTGIVGLRENAFATSADGKTANVAKDEYRAQYLAIKSTLVSLGENFTGLTKTGSGMIKIDLSTAQSEVTVHSTASKPFEASKPAVRLLGSHVSNALFVRSAQASVGIATSGGETATFLTIRSGTDVTSGGIQLGEGANVTTFSQRSGTSFVSFASDITLLEALGGTITTEGEGSLITTAKVGEGAILYPNHTKAGGVSITNLTFQSEGAVDTTRSTKARTFTNVTMIEGATLDLDPAIVTVTNYVFPSVPYQISL